MEDAPLGPALPNGVPKGVEVGTRIDLVGNQQGTPLGPEKSELGGYMERGAL